MDARILDPSRRGRGRTRGLRGLAPARAEILGAVDETFIWALFDRAPLERWSVGRVTLLGDACHAMLPFMAQGAAQAIEDGAALAACLPTDADVPGALRRYETLRAPRVARSTPCRRATRRASTSRTAPSSEARCADGGGSTDWSFSAVAWIYGHDAARTSQGVSPMVL